MGIVIIFTVAMIGWGIVGLLSLWNVRLSPAQIGMFLGVLFVVVDVPLRARSVVNNRVWTPEAGGRIKFFPMWLVGAMFIGMAIVQMATGRVLFD